LTKLLADENVPLETIEVLKREGVNVASVMELSPGLSNREGRVLVTFDKDFGERWSERGPRLRG